MFDESYADNSISVDPVNPVNVIGVLVKLYIFQVPIIALVDKFLAVKVNDFLTVPLLIVTLRVVLEVAVYTVDPSATVKVKVTSVPPPPPPPPPLAPFK